MNRTGQKRARRYKNASTTSSLTSINGGAEGLRAVTPPVGNRPKLCNIEIAFGENRDFDAAENLGNLRPRVVPRSTHDEAWLDHSHGSHGCQFPNELATTVHGEVLLLKSEVS